MKSFRIFIHTPEGCALDETADALVIPGRRGRFGVLADHAPLIGAVVSGILKLDRGGQSSFVVVGDGVVSVRQNEVTLLTDAAIRAATLADAEEKLAEYGEDRRR